MSRTAACDGPVRERVRSPRSRRHLRPTRIRGAAVRHRGSRDQLCHCWFGHRRCRRPAGAVVDPGADRVVVGVRSGPPPPRRALPGVRRRPPRAGTIGSHARPVHPRQHRQRSRPVHRRRHRPPDDRRRAVVRWRDRGVAVGLCPPRSSGRRVLRGPAAVLLGDPARRRAGHRAEHRTVVRPHGEVSGRPVVDRRLGGDGGGHPDRATRPTRFPRRAHGHDRRRPPRASRSTTPNGAAPSGPAPSTSRARTSRCSPR